MSYYESALDWAKLILRGFSPVSGVGKHDAPSLLFPMEAVFEAYVAKREAIAAWLKDPRKAVKVFAKKHIALLDRMIASEQRRAEGEIEQRKRDWGEGAGDAA
jgi:5-methylcytosine-specific restriction enzyme subunit McrC